MNGSYTVELVGSREGTQGPNPSLVLRYAVYNTDDDYLVRALVGAASPPVYDALVKQQIHTEQEGAGFWLGDVEYGPAKLGDPGTVEWSFEIGGGGTRHITQSLKTAGKYAASGAPPNFKGAIGVRRDGNGLAVDGIDIDVTTFAWSETHHLAYIQITPAYINTLYLLRGKVNDDAWRIFSKGEVRLVSISGSARGEWTVPITFNFEASHNVTDLKVGDITGIAKEGWHYLWTFYEDTEDQSAQELVKNPKAVYVEQVHEYEDFSKLGLPDPWN